MLSPLILFIWVLLTIYNRGKAVFIQSRPGKDERLFNLYKFKTLSDPDPKYKTDTERITVFGNFLRKTSLDELPQLINVLKGEMSLIGPRPLLVEYLPLYSDEQRKRHSVLPGITGWAQINGRNSLDWDEKFRFDLFYVENISLFLDFKILLLSFSSIFSRKSVYSPKGEIVPKFKGNKDL